MSNTNERAELIAVLLECLSGPAALTTREATAIKDAADMLEADAQEIAATERQVEILSDELSKCDKAQQVAVPDGCVMVPTETLLDIKSRVNTLATLSLKAERYSLGREIKQAIADMLAAAQGAKPVAQQVAVPMTQLLDDLVLLVWRLAASMKRAKPGSEIAQQAINFINDKGLTPSPLRTAAPQGAKP